MKRTVEFLDADRNKVVAECEITERNGYPEFTMSGKINGSLGQVFHDVNPATKEQEDLIELWDEWHLNNEANPLPKDFEETLDYLLDEIEEYEEENRDREVTENDLELFDDFDEPETALALALMLELSTSEIDDIEEESDNRWRVQGTDYLAGTDAEMDEKCKEYIEDSLWAFVPSFLSQYMGDAGDYAEKILSPIQEKCESGNDAVKALVKWEENADEIVEDAINTDGRGHFLNSYDGRELDYTINGKSYYAYRQ